VLAIRLDSICGICSDAGVIAAVAAKTVHMDGLCVWLKLDVFKVRNTREYDGEMSLLQKIPQSARDEERRAGVRRST